MGYAAGNVASITILLFRRHFSALFCPAGAVYLAALSGHAETASMNIRKLIANTHSSAEDDFFVPEALAEPSRSAEPALNDLQVKTIDDVIQWIVRHKK